MRTLHRLALVCFVATGSGALAASACELPNPDHCINRSSDANAWCAERDPAFAYCSPCYEFNAGCVAREPTPERCPAYGQPAQTGTETGTMSTSGTSG